MGFELNMQVQVIQTVACRLRAFFHSDLISQIRSRHVSKKCNIILCWSSRRCSLRSAHSSHCRCIRLRKNYRRRYHHCCRGFNRELHRHT